MPERDGELERLREANHKLRDDALRRLDAKDDELERLEEANKRLQGAWFDRGVELERLREALERIGRTDFGLAGRRARVALASRRSTESDGWPDEIGPRDEDYRKGD